MAGAPNLSTTVAKINGMAKPTYRVQVRPYVQRRTVQRRSGDPLFLSNDLLIPRRGVHVRSCLHTYVRLNPLNPRLYLPAANRP